MRKIVIVLLCLILTAGCLGVTAYFTTRADAQNPFDIGRVTTTITEEFDPPAEVLPGSVIHKEVKIRNTDLTEAYVRVQILFSDSRMEQLCSEDYNTAAWEYSDSDGWWYLKTALAPGGISPALFTAVTVSSGADAGKLLPFEIFVRQESRQSLGVSSPAEAWT